MCITPNGQLLLLLEVESDRLSGRIGIHSMVDGKQYAEAKFKENAPSNIFEMFVYFFSINFIKYQ